VPLPAFLDSRLVDVRWAWKSVRRAPTTSLLACLSLALGIGANTAIFSIVHALLLRSLPVKSPQELHLVASGTAAGRVSWNYPDYLAFRDRAKGFSVLAAGSGVSTVGFQSSETGAVGPAELVELQFVSGNYFETLGIRPAIGRLFNPADDAELGGAPWAVLSHAFWRARLGGDPQAVGRTIRLNGYPFTIVGVVARGFKGFEPTSSPSVYVPMVMHSEVRGVPAGIWNTRHYWWFRVVGRVSTGTALKPIESQLTAIYRSQEEEERKVRPREGQVNQALTVVLIPAGRGYSFVRNTLQTPLLVLMAVVGLVLIIACANVANIMLARGVARRREIALRLAVGAGRGRVAMQLMTESLIIALLGGLAGVALAYGGIRLLLQHFVPTVGWAQVSLDVSPDLTVLGVTLLMAIVTGMLAGMAPGLQATRPDMVDALKDDVPGRPGRSRALLRRLLVVSQVALSLLLLVGAMLFVRSLSGLRQLDAGFRRDHALFVSIDPARNGYKGQRLKDFYESLRARVGSLPGVSSASLASITPLAGMRWNGDFAVEGYQFKDGDRKYVDMNAVGPRYFEAVGIPLLLGRDFRDEDNPATVPDPPDRLTVPGEAPEAPGPRVAIVTESFARTFLSGGSPIGRRLCRGAKYEAACAYEVIGVVGDARYFELREAAEPMIYVPTWRGGMDSRSLCLRTTSATAGLIESIRKAVREIDPAVPLLRTLTIEQQVDSNIVSERLMASLAGLFGVLALLLASVGLYGVIAYLVTRRTREIGIRLALGANRMGVLRLVMADAAVLVGVGAVIGIAASLALSRLVRTLLYGVSPNDPATMVLAVVALFTVAALAVLGPVRRALGINPNEALRYE